MDIKIKFWIEQAVITIIVLAMFFVSFAFNREITRVISSFVLFLSIVLCAFLLTAVSLMAISAIKNSFLGFAVISSIFAFLAANPSVPIRSTFAIIASSISVGGLMTNLQFDKTWIKTESFLTEKWLVVSVFAQFIISAGIMMVFIWS